ncbi:methionyl-tRNA formyltransferase [Rarobacter incanus]|uniref:Methionyl-tRNA formyltransferase n=1 Tax=Rarobacter incanus TaxID=153494 RepID=A0A542SM01_9MICO|nr:methionyl-tRNA formyltransferase [Rarobacter incanus]TQK75656.1 methionyl-tRNA formyltransferase [Rarobacter incanus]
MRILFAGTPEVAIPSLEALAGSSHEVVGVLTRADARRGRGRALRASPVKVRAAQLGLDVSTERPRGEEFEAWLRDKRVDAVAVVAYGEILRPAVLEIPAHGWINLHFSLLPQWRGAAPVQRAIIAGDEFTGATTFVIEPDLDTGPIIGYVTQRVSPGATSGELFDLLAHAGAGLMVATMDAIADGSADPQPQSGAPTYAAKLTPAEGEIQWTRPALAAARHIAGFTPDPGAWTTLPGGARLGIGPVSVARPDDDRLGGRTLAPGQVLVTKRAVFVGTGTAAIELGEVSPQGKKPMNAADWARGARLSDDTRLGER